LKRCIFFEIARDENSGDSLKEGIGDFALGGSERLQREDELSVGEGRFGIVGAVEVIGTLLDLEDRTDNRGKLFGGVEGEMDTATEGRFGNGIGREHSAEAL